MKDATAVEAELVAAYLRSRGYEVTFLQADDHGVRLSARRGPLLVDGSGLRLGELEVSTPALPGGQRGRGSL